jgi:SAM-dependent methyltransferase
MHVHWFTDVLIAVAVVAGLSLLRWVIHRAVPRLFWIDQPGNLRQRVIARYQGIDFHAWVFANVKTAMDPMFDELPELLSDAGDVRTFLDLGCGFGIAGCWLLEHFPKAIGYAADPCRHRVSAASAAMGNRGHVYRASAPDFQQSDFPDHFDVIFSLDMCHFLDDAALDLTLRRLRDRLLEGGQLILRCPVDPQQPDLIERRIYKLGPYLGGAKMYFRTVEQVRRQIVDALFDLNVVKQTGDNTGLFWFIGTASGFQPEHVMSDQRARDHQHQNDHMNHDHKPEVQVDELVPLLQKS